MTRPSVEAAPTRAILERAIASDREAVRALVDALSPVIQARCARMLIRRRGAIGRDVRQEVVDLTQHILMALFADGGRVLRSWDPGRGASLENFVGLVAEREVAAILRSRRRDPWIADPVQDDDLEQAAGAVSGPEWPPNRRPILIVSYLSESETSGLGILEGAQATIGGVLGAALYHEAPSSAVRSGSNGGPPA